MKPVRTVVVAPDQRRLRALARLLSTERALKLCGFAWDVPTALTVTRAVRAQLLLLDAGTEGLAGAEWPAGTRRILVADDPASGRNLRCDARVTSGRLAADLPPLLHGLFP